MQPSPIMDIQESQLPKRVVTLIKNYPPPKLIYEAITTKEIDYSPQYKPKLPTRDRAILAAHFADAGRGAEICGGHAYSRSLPTQLGNDGKRICVVCSNKLEGSQRKFCSSPCRKEVHSHRPPTILEENHLGLLIENLSFNQNFILISDAPVVKRSPHTKEKYGLQATRRPTFAIPLKIGLYDNPFWDQLVPFAWLIKEYYDCYILGQKKQGKLFNIQNKAAYRIAKEITGNYLNWFRAQGKHFYGYFLLTDVIKLSRFVNDKDLKTESNYIGYDWTEQLKDKSMAMDPDWIEPAVETIKVRIEAAKV